MIPALGLGFGLFGQFLVWLGKPRDLADLVRDFQKGNPLMAVGILLTGLGILLLGVSAMLWLWGHAS